MDAAACDGAVVAGLHLEGPWLAPSRLRRARSARRCAARTRSSLPSCSTPPAARCALLTLAPELDGADAVIAAAVARGVVVSIGHTDATYAQAPRRVRCRCAPSDAPGQRDAGDRPP